MKPRAAASRSVQGFTLIEILVALFIVSIGILGMAGMKMASMQSTYGSYGRSQALVLAYEIVDRMRANRDAALNGSYNLALGDATPACGGSLPDCDVNDWLDSVAAQLPEGDGAIDVQADGTTVVQTQWDPSRLESGLRDGAAPGGLVTFTLRTQL